MLMPSIMLIIMNALHDGVDGADYDGDGNVGTEYDD